MDRLEIIKERVKYGESSNIDAEYVLRRLELAEAVIKAARGGPFADEVDAFDSFCRGEGA